MTHRDVSFKATMRPMRAKAATRVAPVKRVVVAKCSSEASPVMEGARKAATALAVATLATSVSYADVAPAHADVAGLTPCSESKPYQKRLKNEVKALNKRLKQYEPGSAPALALEASIARTETRFAKYANDGLLCGSDGLPHLISDPGLALRFNHAGDVWIPTWLFLYSAGAIGWVGREYLIKAREAAKPMDKEIIIDVPLALSVFFQGAVWPVRAYAAWRNGTLLEKDENITISPR